ncbi:hypothetical protein ACFYE9_10690 [Rhizobium leguminosarum]|uniref:Uncharacterized protein n=1 Tax=Rhizobium leguminosarum TaxID=384 RepID=A0ACD5F692_RHILE|nr:hypothetical protein [Rhizobium leguminosarum]
MAIPISRFASVTGDIAKAQGDGKAFSSLPGQCEEIEILTPAGYAGIIAACRMKL